MTVVLLSLGYEEHLPYAAILALLPGFALVVWLLLERDNLKAQKKLMAYHRGVMDERARAEAEKKRNEESKLLQDQQH
jgi:Flp pilus assembly protein protease CpaA